MKILLAGNAPSCPTLISKLIILWLSNSTQGMILLSQSTSYYNQSYYIFLDTKVQQILGVTIAEFAKNSHNTNTIVQSVIPTVTEIATTPIGSKSDLDVDIALKFITSLLMIKSEKHVCTHSEKSKYICNEYFQDTLPYLEAAANICYQINLDPNVRYVRLFVKMLSYFDFTVTPVNNDLLRIYEQAQLALEVNVHRVDLRFHTPIFDMLNT